MSLKREKIPIVLIIEVNILFSYLLNKLCANFF